MIAVRRHLLIRRVVLGSIAFAVCGLVAMQFWDARQTHLRNTRLYREFNEAPVIAHDLTNDGWVVFEAPPRPGPYRLFPDLIGSPVPPGEGEVRFHAQLGSEVIDVGRKLPPGHSYWFVPLETEAGGVTYMVLQSKPKVTSNSEVISR